MTSFSQREDCLFSDDPAQPSPLDALRALPLTLDGVQLVNGTLSAFTENYVKREGHMGDLARFLVDWRSDKPDMTVLTSGSTGSPKAKRILDLRGQ